jgi:hypothetical protein
MLLKLIRSDRSPCIDLIAMSRIARHFLCASLIACHAATTLCGPCLHALSGSSHSFSAASKSDRPDDPTQSRRDSADNCLICHFAAQGQLPVAYSSAVAPHQVADLVVPVFPTFEPRTTQLPSIPRAPPAPASNLS